MCEDKSTERAARSSLLLKNKERERESEWNKISESRNHFQGSNHRNAYTGTKCNEQFYGQVANIYVAQSV